MDILSTVKHLTGLSAAALPLSACRVTRAYLLERHHIDQSGTAIMLAVPYVVSGDICDPDRNVSLYAVPRDYHLYFRELADEILPVLRARFPDYAFALFADHSPIAEADAAARVGLGVVGDHGLLITPDYGSLVFLGEIVTDAPWQVVTGEDTLPHFSDEPPRCEGCGACLAACPMGCASGDRSRCLSALSQKKGVLTDTEQAALRDHPLVWGCDTCQLACPHNRAVIEHGLDTPIPFFRHSRLSHLDAAVIGGMDEDTFDARAYSWRGREVILRNLKNKN